VRTSMILPPNLYGNMNETRILKNGGARHAVWAKRYTSGKDAGRWDQSVNQTWQSDLAVRLGDQVWQSGSGWRGVR
jgi:hypothetical protein